MEYAIYTDELNNILSQLENNQQLLTNLKQNKIDPKSIAFLNPMQPNPEKWEFYNKTQKLKTYKEDNIAATDNYTCYKCKEKKM